MVLAIEQCHKLGFIHRDIKPDVGIIAGLFHLPRFPSPFRSPLTFYLFLFD